jgi:hypothetical protein
MRPGKEERYRRITRIKFLPFFGKHYGLLSGDNSIIKNNITASKLDGSLFSGVLADIQFGNLRDF